MESYSSEADGSDAGGRRSGGGGGGGGGGQQQARLSALKFTRIDAHFGGGSEGGSECSGGEYDELRAAAAARAALRGLADTEVSIGNNALALPARFEHRFMNAKMFGRRSASSSAAAALDYGGGYGENAPPPTTATLQPARLRRHYSRGLWPEHLLSNSAGGRRMRVGPNLSGSGGGASHGVWDWGGGDLGGGLGSGGGLGGPLSHSMLHANARADPPRSLSAPAFHSTKRAATTATLGYEPLPYESAATHVGPSGSAAYFATTLANKTAGNGDG